MSKLPLVDAHLDLAENVTLFDRDLILPVATIRASEKRTRAQATVSLPAMEEGGIAVVIATVTAGFLAADVGEEFEPQSALYRTAEEAEAQALAQIDLYEAWERQGRVRLLRSVNDLDHHLQLWRDDGKPGLVLLMEGADPIVRVADLPQWWQRGLRLIGLVLYNAFLEPRWQQDKSIPVTLADHLRRHAAHVAGLAGWDHVGIDSDFDGGFGREESPQEIDTVADLHKAAAAVPAGARAAVLGANWLTFLRWALPRTS